MKEQIITPKMIDDEILNVYETTACFIIFTLITIGFHIMNWTVLSYFSGGFTFIFLLIFLMNLFQLYKTSSVYIKQKRERINLPENSKFQKEGRGDLDEA